MDMIIQSVLPLPFLDDSEANQWHAGDVLIDLHRIALWRDSLEEDVE